MSDDLVATLHQAGHDYTNKAADLIKAQAARIAELEAALKMSEQRFATLKNDWDRLRRRKVPIYGSAALEGGGRKMSDYHEGLEEGIKIGKAEAAARIAEWEAALDDALTYVWRAHGWSKLKPETQAYKFRKKE